jgi:hypothetical protein
MVDTLPVVGLSWVLDEKSGKPLTTWVLGIKKKQILL